MSEQKYEPEYHDITIKVDANILIEKFENSERYEKFKEITESDEFQREYNKSLKAYREQLKEYQVFPEGVSACNTDEAIWNDFYYNVVLNIYRLELHLYLYHNADVKDVLMKEVNWELLMGIFNATLEANKRGIAARVAAKKMSTMFVSTEESTGILN